MDNNTIKLYEQIVKGGGIFGQSAELYINDPEAQRHFLSQFKNELKRHRNDLIAVYGEQFVIDLEKYE
ncbi:MAG: hypothetical protein V4635_09815 [Bacteroidota bacterium]